MRFLLFLSAVSPAIALAALPVLSTDTLAPGENALSVSASTSRDNADLTLTQAGIAYPGTGSASADAYNGNWDFSPARDMQVGLGAGHTSSDVTDTIHGANVVQYRTHVEGWQDLSWYTRWRFSQNERTAWGVVASGEVPTASDGKAVPLTLVNGVEKPPPPRDGSPGHGYSLFSLSGQVSRRYDHDALEGAASWNTDDNWKTGDSFAIGGTYLHFLGAGNSRAMLGIDEFFYGTYDSGVTRTPSHKATMFAAGITWCPKNDIEVSAATNYIRYDNTTTLYSPSGNTLAVNNANHVGLSIGIRVLML